MDQYRNEATALATEPGARFRVDIRWTSTVPDRLPDDSTVRRTVECATATTVFKTPDAE